MDITRQRRQWLRELDGSTVCLLGVPGHCQGVDRVQKKANRAAARLQRPFRFTAVMTSGVSGRLREGLKEVRRGLKKLVGRPGEHAREDGSPAPAKYNSAEKTEHWPRGSQGPIRRLKLTPKASYGRGRKAGGDAKVDRSCLQPRQARPTWRTQPKQSTTLCLRQRFLFPRRRRMARAGLWRMEREMLGRCGGSCSCC